MITVRMVTGHSVKERDSLSLPSIPILVHSWVCQERSKREEEEEEEVRRMMAEFNSTFA
jgi:hypothetical protein